MSRNFDWDLPQSFFAAARPGFRHRLSCSGDGAAERDSVDLDYVPVIGKGIEPRLRCLGLLAQHRAAAGAGLCILPCFLAADDARLPRVLSAEVWLIRSFWLLARSDIRELARIRATCDLIAAQMAKAAICVAINRNW